MADKPSGTLLFPVDLELTPLETKLAAVHKRMVEGATKSEEAFKTLGISSDRFYAAQKQTAFAAYDAIMHKEKSTLDDRLRAEEAYSAKLRSIYTQQNAVMEGHWNTLGVKSASALNQQKADVEYAFNAISRTVTKGSQDYINIEKAKNDKIKALNDEMVGKHDEGIAGMIRGTLRLYAAYYVVSSVIQGVFSVIMSGIEAIDSLKISSITIASQIANMQGPVNVVENYRKAREYADQLVIALQKVDAESFANYQQILLMNNAMANHGVILDYTNKKQMDAFTSLSNAIAMMATGSNKNLQFTQEINALLTGQLRPTDQIALKVDAIAKSSGEYAGGLKQIVAESKNNQEILEKIAPLLAGINAASEDIKGTWEATKSSLQTTWDILQREIFKDFYKSFVEDGRVANEMLKENKDLIVSIIEIVSMPLQFINLARIAKEAQKGGAAIYDMFHENLGKVIEDANKADDAIFDMIANPAKYVKEYDAKAYIASLNTVSDQVKKATIEAQGVIQKKTEETYAGQIALMNKQAEQWRKNANGNAETEIQIQEYITKQTEAIRTKYQDKAAKTATAAAKKENKIWEQGQKEYESIMQAEYQYAESLGNKAVDNTELQETKKLTKIEASLAKGGISQKQASEATILIESNTQKRLGEIWETGQTKYQKFLTDNTEFAQTENERQINKIIQQETEETNKLVEMRKKGEINLVQFMVGINKIHTNSTKAQTEKSIESAKKIATTNYELIQNIKGYETEAYNFKLKQIADKAAVYIKDKQDEVAVAAWVKDQQIKAMIEYGKSGNDVAMGMNAAFAQMYQNQITWGGAAYQVTTQLFTDMKSTIGTVFFDGMKGDLNDFSTYWDSFMNSMLKTFSDILAQMVVNWLQSQALMASNSFLGTDFSVGGSSGGGLGTLAKLGSAGYSLFGGSGGEADLGLLSIGSVMPEAAMDLGLMSVGSDLGLLSLGETGLMSSLSAMLPGIGWGVAGAGILSSLFGGGDIIGGAVSGIGDIASSVVDTVSSVFEDIGDWFGKGDAFSGGSVIPFAKGDIFSAPTVFPMAKGSVGLMGEAGPEAIMPLTRGSDGKLGVKAQGGNSTPILNIGELRVFIGNTEIKDIARIEADGVIVERNSRGVNNTRRIYG